MRRLTIGSSLITCLLVAAGTSAGATEPADVGEAGLDGGSVPRAMHTATLLPDGGVLIVGGGTEDEVEVPVAEVWDPVSERFKAAGSLAQTRWGHSASLLRDGRVLIVGGGTQHDPDGERPDEQGPFSLASAEVWAPSSGFSDAGSLAIARRGHTATTLTDGRVLVVGGTEAEDPVAAELWDPETGSFSTSGMPLVERNWGHTATLLPDGRVLFVGGQHAEGIGTYDMTLVELATAEDWDPDTGSFEDAGTLDTGRVFHSASLLPDGGVLVVGGFGTDGAGQPTFFDTAVAWDPASDSFVDVGSLAIGRVDHRASVLPDRRVLITGGLGYEGGAPDPEADIGPSLLAQVEIFDPATGSFTSAGRLSEGREYHTATPLPDGRVLITGGGGHEAEHLADPEIWSSELIPSETQDSD